MIGLVGIANKVRTVLTVSMSAAEVNGEPTLLAWASDAYFAVILISVREGQIGELRILLNPEKVAFAARQAAELSHSARPFGRGGWTQNLMGGREGCSRRAR